MPNRRTSTIDPAPGDDTGTAPFVLDVVVAARAEVARGVVALTLAAASGEPLPAWTPGAHIDLELPGTGITRQYSLCGSPGDDAWRIAVLRDPSSRGGSSWLHEHAGEGTHLTVTGLRNNFRFDARGPVVLVAGGIGITPLLPMARAAAAAGTPYELHYAGRSRDAMAFLDELAALDVPVVRHVSDRGGRMAVDSLIAGRAPGTTVYACGPARLLDALTAAAAGTSVTLRTERFQGLDVDGSADRPFEVRCARSGAEVTVPPGRSVLEVLAENGIEQVSQCQEGICGTCETAVLDGEPDHRDALLTDEERAAGDVMMICVSRARSGRLVLDL